MNNPNLSGDQFHGVTVTRNENWSHVSGGTEEDRTFTKANASPQGHYYDAEAHAEGRARRMHAASGVRNKYGHPSAPVRRVWGRP